MGTTRTTTELQTPPTGRGRARSLAGTFAGGEDIGVLCALVAMVVLVTVFHPDFLDIQSVSSLLQQASFYGIIALGMVFMLSLREVDLSVGGNMGFSAMCCAVFVSHGIDPWLAAGLALLVGICLGAANALVSNIFGLPMIIVTLGTLSMYQGMALVISNGGTVAGGNVNGSFFTIFGGAVDQIPVAAIAFGVLTLVIWFVYRKTAFAFAVRAIGSNPVAARLSGYPINRVRLSVAGLVGLLCAVAGLLSYAFFGSVDSSLGNGLELQVIAATVIGGTALSGGRGSVPGAFLGALIISVIAGGLTEFGVSINWASFVTGAVIVIAVSLDAVVKRRQRAATARA
jgi:ribose transport system permease protein